MIIKVLTVSKLNSYIKKSFDNDVILNNVYIKGEISNFKIHSSGHIYFAIKDITSKLNCVMFRDYAEELKFLPKEGDKVVIKGRISVYEKEGTYQLYAREMELEGIGELYYEFNALKEKLKDKGIFSEEHKKEIPKYAKCIGVVTSPTSAAVRDIINVSKRRNPNVKLLIYPSLVQGDIASKNLIEGIRTLNEIDEVDTIIIARGGGSIEELWAFNNEELAYEIYNSKKPIITGVGHETDFTIVDFVSDRRAPTPSAAAEIAVPIYEDMKENIRDLQTLLENSIENSLREEKNKINLFVKSLEVNNPQNYIVHQYEYIDSLKNRLHHNIELKLNFEKQNLENFNLLLKANNPYNVVNKGYSIIQDENQKIVRSIRQLKEKKNLYITLKDGKSKVRIEVLEE